MDGFQNCAKLSQLIFFESSFVFYLGFIHKGEQEEEEEEVAVEGGDDDGGKNGDDNWDEEDLADH